MAAKEHGTRNMTAKVIFSETLELHCGISLAFFFFIIFSDITDQSYWRHVLKGLICENC